MCALPNSPPALTIDVLFGDRYVPVMITSSPTTPFAFSPATATYTPMTPQVSTALPAMMMADGQYWTHPTVMSLPMAKSTARAAGNVVVRSVWAHNLREEVELIESLLRRYRYAAVDTEFPGTVYRPKVPTYALTAEKKYALLKANVDELHLIQLGLTLFDAAGRLPDLGTGVQYVWEFNFREFDVRRHRHAQESIALLRSKGVDFDRTRRDGIDAAAFGPRLRKLLRGGLGDAGVITFSGAYDLAYLVKMMLGSGYKLPATPAEFESVVKAMIRKRLYDVKEMARRCPRDVDLRGGLDRVAGKLDVRRAVGEAHQAGSDSLLTCQTFIKIRERYFVGDDDLTTVAGIVAGITAC
jgi:CCR4-NOT transcription complex subunit 7/8